MRSEDRAQKLVVIYDGECDFCQECVRWVEKRATITALPFQSVDLAKFNLTYERCSKEVVVIVDEIIYGGVDAVAVLLSHRGNRYFSSVVSSLGNISKRAYRWVATHRSSFLVRFLSRVLKFLNS